MAANSTFADYTFAPWRVRNGRYVVAAESAWRKPAAWNRKAAAGNSRPRVLVPYDLFEDWTGLMSANDAAAMHVCSECGAWRTMEQMCHGPNAHMPLTMSDVRRRLFALIDATPNLDWLVPTAWPENVMRMLPPLANSKVLGAYTAMEVLTRPNLWLGAVVHDQQTADARIPHLLQVPAAVRFVRCELRGAVDMASVGPLHWDVLHGWKPAHGDYPEGCNTDRIDWLLVAGGTEPIHPDWVRSLRDQAQAAGVPFRFEGWGEWAPGNSCPGGDLYDRDRTKIESGMFTYSGDWTPGGPNPFRQTMDRVGRRAAGRLLDGREWNEFPTVEATS